MKREEIIEHIQPFVDELVDRLVALVPELVRSHVAELLGTLNAEPAPKKARGRRDIKPAKQPRAKSTKRSGCSKCGKDGHNARTCGRENEEPAKASTLVSKPPPSTSRADRFAAIEASANARRATRLDA